MWNILCYKSTPLIELTGQKFKLTSIDNDNAVGAHGVQGNIPKTLTFTSVTDSTKTRVITDYQLASHTEGHEGVYLEGTFCIDSMSWQEPSR